MLSLPRGTITITDLVHRYILIVSVFIINVVVAVILEGFEEGSRRYEDDVR